MIPRKAAARGTWLSPGSSLAGCRPFRPRKGPVEKGVLFVCTGNAARSQLAEGIAKAVLPPGLPVFSAGTNPSTLSPFAVEAAAEIGLDIRGRRSKGLSEVPMEKVGLAVTLCDSAAAACPVIPGAKRLHWPVPDPGGAASGPAAFRAARDELLARIAALAADFAPEPAVGVVGGTGFYDLPGLSGAGQVEVDTPFGRPSAPLIAGRLAGRRVVFLARHGPSHGLLPSEVNARANVYALKRMGVTKLISISAVGSLREEIAPGHAVIPRQFIDMTRGRPGSFFGGGVVAHVGMAEPVCAGLADGLAEAAAGQGSAVHRSGVYLCIEGPQFSTRAESALWRSFGADVVGMTNMPEARLAREAEMCFATLALTTDYDCWRERGGSVNVTDVMSVLRANAETAKAVVAAAVAEADPAAGCACGRSLDRSLLTPPASLGPAQSLRLHAVLSRVLRSARA